MQRIRGTKTFIFSTVAMFFLMSCGNKQAELTDNMQIVEMPTELSEEQVTNTKEILPEKERPKVKGNTDIERVEQNYAALGNVVDVLSTMVYPSHYGLGVFGFDVPDAHPHDTVYQALLLSQETLKQDTKEDQNTVIVRPWLQSFTATWVNGHISYGEKEIQEQIQAVYDAGYEEWILWNATCRYPLKSTETEEIDP